MTKNLSAEEAEAAQRKPENEGLIYCKVEGGSPIGLGKNGALRFFRITRPMAPKWKRVIRDVGPAKLNKKLRYIIGTASEVFPNFPAGAIEIFREVKP